MAAGPTVPTADVTTVRSRVSSSYSKAKPVAADTQPHFRSSVQSAPTFSRMLGGELADRIADALVEDEVRVFEQQQQQLRQSRHPSAATSDAAHNR